MTGVTRLEDLSRGPPDNYGMDDSALLDNIVNEVQNSNSNYERKNSNDVSKYDDGYYSESEDYDHHTDIINNQNQHLAQPTPYERRQQYNPKRVRGTNSIPKRLKSKPANVYTQFASRISQDTTEIITEVLMVAGLIYLSQMENVIKVMNNFLPNAMKILDTMTGAETFNGSIIKALVLSIIYFVFRKYMN